MKKIILFTIIFTFIFLFLIYFYVSKNREGTVPTPIPIPSQSLIQPTPKPEGAIPNNYDNDPISDERNRRSYIVGQLIDKLPHQETNLVLSYDIDRNIFTATIDSSNKELGLAQLDAVLKANGIASRSWIENLKILYK